MHTVSVYRHQVCGMSWKTSVRTYCSLNLALRHVFMSKYTTILVTCTFVRYLPYKWTFGWVKLVWMLNLLYTFRNQPTTTYQHCPTVCCHITGRELISTICCVCEWWTSRHVGGLVDSRLIKSTLSTSTWGCFTSTAACMILVMVHLQLALLYYVLPYIVGF